MSLLGGWPFFLADFKGDHQQNPREISGGDPKGKPKVEHPNDPRFEAIRLGEASREASRCAEGVNQKENGCDHRFPFWLFCSKNRWVSIPGLPGGLIIYQGNPSISPKITPMVVTRSVSQVR